MIQRHWEPFELLKKRALPPNPPATEQHTRIHLKHRSTFYFSINGFSKLHGPTYPEKPRPFSTQSVLNFKNIAKRQTWPHFIVIFFVVFLLFPPQSLASIPLDTMQNTKYKIHHTHSLAQLPLRLCIEINKRNMAINPIKKYCATARTKRTIKRVKLAKNTALLLQKITTFYSKCNNTNDPFSKA